MTLSDLKQVRKSRIERELVTKRLSAELSKSSNYVTDYATDYSTGRGRTITLRGYAIADPEKVNALLAEHKELKEKLDRTAFEAERYIVSIPDSTIRTLLTLYILEGKTWNDVAKLYYGNMNGDTARKAVERYFK